MTPYTNGVVVSVYPIQTLLVDTVRLSRQVVIFPEFNVE